MLRPHTRAVCCTLLALLWLTSWKYHFLGLFVMLASSVLYSIRFLGDGGASRATMLKGLQFYSVLSTYMKPVSCSRN